MRLFFCVAFDCQHDVDYRRSACDNDAEGFPASTEGAEVRKRS